jgi:hypothetical protein
VIDLWGETMHTHQVFLIKADNHQDALYGTLKFLERYKDKEWDWYAVGGRWSWSGIFDKHRSQIVTPTSTYTNTPVTLTFPDGEIKSCKSGIDAEYAIHDWVSKHPIEAGEVIDATHPLFWERLDDAIESSMETRQWHKERIVEKISKNEKDMIDYLKDTISSKRWHFEQHFWNITNKKLIYNKEEIMKCPSNWYLVNIDTHN